MKWRYQCGKRKEKERPGTPYARGGGESLNNLKEEFEKLRKSVRTHFDTQKIKRQKA